MSPEVQSHTPGHEAQRVVHANEEGFDERWQVQLHETDLDERHERDHQACAHRRPEHVSILTPVVGDIVLAGLAGVVGDAQRQQPRVAPDEVAHAVLAIVLGRDVEGEVDYVARGSLGRCGIDQPQQRAQTFDELALVQR